ncbi:MAG: hypothetical protein ABSH26_18075, partial [Opitutaceae bacterium]
MSDHSSGWGLKTYLDPIIKDATWRLDPRETREERVDVTGVSIGGTFVAILRRYIMTDVGSGHQIIAYELTWSPLVEPFKRKRFTVDLEQCRPVVNKYIRNVLDENIADVALYVSRFDNDILARSVSRALEMFYRGEMDGATGSTPQNDLRESPVVFITESLGSKMLFDAVADHDAKEIALGTPGHDTHFDDMVIKGHYVFMMANQLALLDMPDPSDVGPVPSDSSPVAPKVFSRLSGFITAREHARGRRPEMRTPLPLLFVAFNDPYDDLTYSIEQPDFPAGFDVSIDNFFSHNVKWDWFGLIENPGKAHTT